MKRVIWIITEGSPGHFSQSIGLVHAIQEIHPTSVVTFKSRPKIGGFLRMLYRTIVMGPKGRGLSHKTLQGPIGLEPIPVDTPSPDLIVSSGGKSVFAARSLAVRYGAPYVLIGERKPYPPGWFHSVLTPSALEREACDVKMDLIPTKITPQVVEEAADTWTDKPDGRLWAMLIGGSSRSHHYTAEDWQQLAEGMVNIARREGIRWVLTTSRRTGRNIEKLLREWIPREAITDAVWWCEKPEKKLAAYLGAAETIWVTQDSVSMITEAVVSAKPVMVIRPVSTPFPETSYMPGYLNNLAERRMVTRLPISEMSEPLPEDWQSPNPHDPTAELATTLCKRLGWLG